MYRQDLKDGCKTEFEVVIEDWGKEITCTDITKVIFDVLIETIGTGFIQLQTEFKISTQKETRLKRVLRKFLGKIKLLAQLLQQRIQTEKLEKNVIISFVFKIFENIGLFTRVAVKSVLNVFESIFNNAIIRLITELVTFQFIAVKYQVLVFISSFLKLKIFQEWLGDNTILKIKTKLEKIKADFENHWRKIDI